MNLLWSNDQLRMHVYDFPSNAVSTHYCMKRTKALLAVVPLFCECSEHIEVI